VTADEEFGYDASGRIHWLRLYLVAKYRSLSNPLNSMRNLLVNTKRGCGADLGCWDIPAHAANLVGLWQEYNSRLDCSMGAILQSYQVVQVKSKRFVSS
jgi:hypothetical protein